MRPVALEHAVGIGVGIVGLIPLGSVGSGLRAGAGDFGGTDRDAGGATAAVQGSRIVVLGTKDHGAQTFIELSLDVAVGMNCPGVGRIVIANWGFCTEWGGPVRSRSN